MITNSVFDQIDKIKIIVERWSKTPEISDIERELVLDKLKSIYEEVMFMQRETISDSDSFLTESVDSSSCVAQPQPQAKVEVEVEQEPEPEPEQMIVTESASSLTPEPEVVDILDIVAEKEEAISEFKLQEESQTEVAIQEQVLFEHEPISRAQVDKKVILSLYGESKTPPPTPRPTVENSGVKTQIKPQPQNQSNVEHSQNSDNVAPKKVLGEVLTSGNVAFNEMMGKQNVHQDMASKIHTQSVVDLRQSIGINDKFAMIRDLFAGNVASYEETINNLNQFTDIDEAMIYIQENYNWTADSDGLNFLIDLLERKLS